VLSALVKKHGVDLVVAGMHERGSVSRLILGSAIEEIFHAVSCPLLTTGPQMDGQQPVTGEFSEIVYATDFGPASLHAWSYALSMVQLSKAHLTLVHILRDDTPSYAREGNEVSYQEQLRRMLPANGAVSADSVVRFGVPAAGILAVAKERDASLIVMGATDQISWSAAHLPRTTAYQVVCGSLCPVLTVRG